MSVTSYKDIPAEAVEQGARGVKIRWLITEAMGAEHFVMRHFEIEPSGYTPRHEHAWEHEVFILSGTGHVLEGDAEQAFGPGDVIFVPPGERHQFRNTGRQPVALLCLIPSRDRGEL